MKERIRVVAGWIEFERNDLEQIGDRMVPRRIDAEFPATEGMPSLRLVIEVRRGVPECTSLTIEATADGREVRAMDLSAVRIEDWIEELVGTASLGIVPTPGYVPGKGYPQVTRVRGGRGGAAHDRAGRSAVRNARRSVRRSVTPQLLTQVATLYRDHIDDKPTEAVQDAFGVSYRTAGRYVQLARESELLPRTTPGRKEA